MKLCINQPIFSVHKECIKKNQKQSITSTNPLHQKQKTKKTESIQQINRNTTID